MLDLDTTDTVRWVGRTPITIQHDDTIKALRSLGDRLSDLGHAADAKAALAGARALGTAIYYLKQFTHEELEWEVADDDPLYVRSLLEDVIAQLPAFHPSYKPAIQLRAAIIARGGE